MIWCTPKDAFIGSHSDIRVETGIPVYQMGNFQESFEWGRGSDMVYGSEMYTLLFFKSRMFGFVKIKNSKPGKFPFGTGGRRWYEMANSQEMLDMVHP